MFGKFRLNKSLLFTNELPKCEFYFSQNILHTTARKYESSAKEGRPLSLCDPQCVCERIRRLNHQRNWPLIISCLPQFDHGSSGNLSSTDLSSKKGIWGGRKHDGPSLATNLEGTNPLIRTQLKCAETGLTWHVDSSMHATQNHNESSLSGFLFELVLDNLPTFWLGGNFISAFVYIDGWVNISLNVWPNFAPSKCAVCELYNDHTVSLYLVRLCASWIWHFKSEKIGGFRNKISGVHCSFVAAC